MTKRAPLGVLLLHGFTSSLDTVRGLVPTIEALQLPYRMPVLRGHGGRYQDLRGVRARDWAEDAEAALLALGAEADRVVIMGLSMGALVALDLASRHPERIAGLALVAPAVRFADPAVLLTPILKRLFAYWPSPSSFTDPERAKACTNYDRFATDAFASLLDYQLEIEQLLPRVQAPTLILHSRRDIVAHPHSATVLMRRLGSRDKDIQWYEHSGHEMLMDLEAEAIFARIGLFLERLLGREAATA